MWIEKGMIVLACHNVDAWVNKVLGEYSPVFDVEHIFLFNPATLRHLVESCGFVLRDEGRVMNTYPLSYWFRYAPIVNGLVERFPLWVTKYRVHLLCGKHIPMRPKGIRQIIRASDGGIGETDSKRYADPRASNEDASHRPRVVLRGYFNGTLCGCHEDGLPPSADGGSGSIHFKQGTWRFGLVRLSGPYGLPEPRDPFFLL